jgi:hypothetical protein
MSNTKSRLGNNPLTVLNGTAKRIDVHGRKIARVVQYVETKRLKPNPNNARFFKELSIADFENLVENIKVNGIHTPLIARQDNTLIAGHNRLEAAKELELEHVPVQYLEDEMTEQEEIKFIISDNLLRRHLSNSEKFDLYRVLFPNFDERVKLRPNANFEDGDTVPTSDVKPLTATMIAKETGQTREAVKKQLQREEQRERRENEKNRRTQEEVAVMSAERSIEQFKAREREAERSVRSALDEIALQVGRDDVSDEWKVSIVQKLRKAVEKIERLLPA